MRDIDREGTRRRVRERLRLMNADRVWTTHVASSQEQRESGHGHLLTRTECCERDDLVRDAGSHLCEWRSDRPLSAGLLPPCAAVHRGLYGPRLRHDQRTTSDMDCAKLPTMTASIKRVSSSLRPSPTAIRKQYLEGRETQPATMPTTTSSLQPRPPAARTIWPTAPWGAGNGTKNPCNLNHA